MNRALSTLYLALLAYGGTENGILVAKSSDGGETFGEPVRVDDEGDKPYIAVDPATNAVYVVWSNTGAGGTLEAFFSKSTDGGATWQEKISEIAFVQEIVYDPRNARWVYAATEGSPGTRLV